MPGALTLIKERTDESVGYISINNNKSGGTGFRAGDVYLITAYHVFESEIGKV